MKAGDAIDINRGPYGMNGGTVLSGAVNTLADAFWYYPVVASTALITLANVSGSVSASFSPGVGVWGRITSVSQSSGLAILYSGSNNNQ